MQMLLASTFQGFPGSILGKLMSKTSKDYIETEVQFLKKRIENT